MNAEARGRGLPSNEVMFSFTLESSALANAVRQNSNEALRLATSLSLSSVPLSSSVFGRGTSPPFQQKK
jgi:hypothetical protein